MSSQMRRLALVLAQLLSIIGVTAVFAQDGDTLTLRLSRDFGFGLGQQIEGRFSYRVDAPDDVVRVEFLLDDAVIGEDAAPPFRFDFQTGDFDLGAHTLQALGYTGDGRVLRSAVLTREFVPPRNAGVFIGIIVGVVVLAALVSLAISRLGGGYGLLGGAVCPHCGRPYRIHVWSPHFMGVRLDRCPHCGRWARVRAATTEALAAAEAVETTEASAPDEESTAADDDLRRRLDDSRFEDV